MRRCYFHDLGPKTDIIIAQSVGKKPKAQPHEYNTESNLSPTVNENLHLMPECKPGQDGKKWFLYPILEEGRVFEDGMDVGKDRVLVVADILRDDFYNNFVYCGAVYHPEKRLGHFEPCDEA